MYILQSGTKNLSSAVTAVEGTAKTYMWLKRLTLIIKKERKFFSYIRKFREIE
jgi:hypothetical protein